jgi:CRISPR/Cas system-associated exonuclease Cas4 (RecB family)
MRYLEGLKEGFRSVESYLGHVVHDVLEWLYAERAVGQTPEPETVLEEFATRWSEGWSEDIAIIRRGDAPETYLQSGREMLDRFMRTVLTRDRSETVALEQRLTARLDDDIVFVGFADRIGRTEAGQLFVIDYKTSKNEGDGSDFSEGLQAPLYAACVLQQHSDETALAGYHYLRHGTTSWRRIDRAEAGRLFDRCREFVRLTEAAEEFPARPGVLCAWCGFNGQCPDAAVAADLSGGLLNSSTS